MNVAYGILFFQREESEEGDGSVFLRGPPGPPPLGFPFGIPGLRHPLFSSGIVLFRKKLDIIFVALQTLVQGFKKYFIFDIDSLYRVITK